MEKTCFEENVFRSNMKVGGINPSVLRELSGLYQPFEKALKELIVNSLDANASKVEITFSEDFNNVRILDNGQGMTPYEVKYNFLRIGKNKTEGQVLERIGGKGIGFLAPARYCNKMILKTTSTRSYRITRKIKNSSKRVDIASLFGEAVMPTQFFQRYSSVTAVWGDSVQLEQEVDYGVQEGFLSLSRNYRELALSISIDCSPLILEASIDFDFLLNQNTDVSLEEVEDFCQITIHEDKDEIHNSYTEIELAGLKDLAKDPLAQTRKKGNVRNVASMDGLEQFMWRLSASIPVNFADCSNLPEELAQILSARENTLQSVIVRIGKQEWNLKKPIFNPSVKMDDQQSDLWTHIDVRDKNFVMEGYILGQQNVIYPAELRGISIKVKNVEIGPPTFLGLENSLTGAKKAALNQITGEINILNGMDAIEEITPGRDGFYTESKGYQMLLKHLLGEDGEQKGVLFDIIDSVIFRSQMNSAVENMIQKAKGIREELLKVSYTLNSFMMEHQEVIELFVGPARELVLLNQDDYFVEPEQMLKTYKVQRVLDIATDYVIDYLNRTVLINANSDLWSKEVYILGRYFSIHFKKGKNIRKLCEIDGVNQKIYINWEHPTRTLMGDRNFIRNAVCWAVALSSYSSSPDEMVNTALLLIANDS